MNEVQLMFNVIKSPQYMVDNVFQLIEGEYRFVLDIEQFIDLIGEQYDKWFNYSGDLYKRCTEISSELDVTNIANDIISEKWSNSFLFNANILKEEGVESVKYIEEEKKLIIYRGAEISIIEGFRVLLAFESAYKVNPRISKMISIRLTNKSIYELHESFAQICFESWGR